MCEREKEKERGWGERERRIVRKGGREGGREKGTDRRQIYFKKLAHMIVGVGKFNIHRAGQQP